MLPYHANLDHIGRNFDAEDILPSLRKLIQYTAAVRRPVELNHERVALRGRRSGRDLSTQYGQGRSALWVGMDVFFYVEDETTETVTNVRVPTTHTELPPWVLDLLQEANRGLEIFAIQRNVDSYLQRMKTPSSRSIGLLSTINWAAVPLVWTPMFMRDTESTVTCEEATTAQIRLIKGLAPSGEEPEVVAEAIEILHRVTGL